MFHAHDLFEDHEHVLNAFCYGNHSIGSETLPEMVHEYCAIHKCGEDPGLLESYIRQEWYKIALL